MENREDFSAEFAKFLENYTAQQNKFKRIPFNILNTLTTLVIASLALISALAWDHYLKSLFEAIFHESESLSGLFAYAIIVTTATVIITIILGNKKKGIKNIGRTKF